MGHNWEKYCIGLFHVSEHLGHFKAITNFKRKMENILVWGYPPPPMFGKKQTISRFLCEMEQNFRLCLKGGTGVNACPNFYGEEKNNCVAHTFVFKHTKRHL